MEIGVINGTRESAMAITYGLPHHDTIKYLNEKMNQVASSLGQVPDAVKGMFQSLRTSFNQFFSDEAVERARKELSVQSLDINPAAIAALVELELLQKASISMQRWVMAEPTVRNMFHQQRLHGYNETYFDTDPGCVGDRHYDYRRAIDGLVIEEDDDFVCNIYADDLREGDSHLNIQEQVRIQVTWESLRNHLAQKKKELEDPTNPNGGYL